MTPKRFTTREMLTKTPDLNAYLCTLSRFYIKRGWVWEVLLRCCNERIHKKPWCVSRFQGHRNMFHGSEGILLMCAYQKLSCNGWLFWDSSTIEGAIVYCLTLSLVCSLKRIWNKLGSLEKIKVTLGFLLYFKLHIGDNAYCNLITNLRVDTLSPACTLKRILNKVGSLDKIKVAYGVFTVRRAFHTQQLYAFTICLPYEKTIIGDGAQDLQNL